MCDNREINTFYRVTKETSHTSCRDTDITWILDVIGTKEELEAPPQRY